MRTRAQEDMQGIPVSVIGVVSPTCRARGRWILDAIASLLVVIPTQAAAAAATQVTAGFSHTCAVSTTGSLSCWGRNDQGKLGDGTTFPRPTAVDVSDLTSGVAAVACRVQSSSGTTWPRWDWTLAGWGVVLGRWVLATFEVDPP